MELTSKDKDNQGGFSLIELMAVVTIMGILAAVAIPTLYKYSSEARNTETQVALKQIADGALIFYSADRAESGGMTTQGRALPASVPQLPAGTVNCSRKSPDIDWSSFKDLKFVMSKPFYGHYAWTNTTAGGTHSGYASVLFNIDCDSTVGEQRINLSGGNDGMRSGVLVTVTED